jgi:hypothetical protein
MWTASRMALSRGSSTKATATHSRWISIRTRFWIKWRVCCFGIETKARRIVLTAILLRMSVGARSFSFPWCGLVLVHIWPLLRNADVTTSPCIITATSCSCHALVLRSLILFLLKPNLFAWFLWLNQVFVLHQQSFLFRVLFPVVQVSYRLPGGISCISTHVIPRILKAISKLSF